MNDYKEILDIAYRKQKETECPPDNKFVFVGDYIFDFTTYDGSMSSFMAKLMLDVCGTILNGHTFKYVENKTNYLNYLLMVNMPFLEEKIEWGTSIRGAWFDECGHRDDKEDYYVIAGIYGLNIPKEDIKLFISDLLEWVKKS